MPNQAFNPNVTGGVALSYFKNTYTDLSSAIDILTGSSGNVYSFYHILISTNTSQKIRIYSTSQDICEAFIEAYKPFILNTPSIPLKSALSQTIKLIGEQPYGTTIVQCKYSIGD